jgi:hypothetical protein
LRGSAIFGTGSFVLDTLTSVASGVKMLSEGRTASRAPTDSLLCAFENEGYGKLVFDSEPFEIGSVSASLMFGIDDLLRDSDGSILAFSSTRCRSLESESLVELLRRDVLCRLSDLSSLDDDFLKDSLPRSGGGS